MTVISLFDGMSCGQIALNNLGIKYDAYYASEVDKYAMQVTKDNYPNTIHVGDVSKISFKRGRLRDADGNKYRIRGEVILIGGSPCQGFSFAGKMKGAATKCNIEITTLDQYLKLKDEGFAFEGQSYLFWEYVRLREEIKPKYFLLENVMMVKKWWNMFNEAMGAEAIEINSALVSAQNRKRLYWSNIPNITQPDDKGILLKDILEDEVDDKYYMSQVATMRSLTNPMSRAFTKDVKKSGALLANQVKQSTDGLYHIADIDIKGHDQIKRVYSEMGKSRTLTTCTGGHREPKLLVPENTKKGYIEVNDGECFDNTFPKSTTRRGRMMARKCNALLTSHQFFRYEHPRVRKLTPTECERLQTVPDGYTKSVSNSQRYKMLGNGWTVAVVEHILKGMR